MKKGGLNYKFTMLFLAFSLFLAFILCFLNIRAYWKDLLEEYFKKAKYAASTTAFLLDGDKVERYSQTLEMDSEYQKEIWFIDNLAVRLGVENLYVMVPISEEEIMFVYDAGKLEEGMSDSTRQKLGRTTDFTGKNYSAAKDLILNGKQAEGLEITNEEFGYLASAYELLYSAEGEVIGFVGADYSIKEMEKSLVFYIFRHVIWVFVIVSIGIVVLLHIVKNGLILPIQEISKDAARFAIDYKEEPNKGFLGKNTGDELEELGYTFYKMKKDIINYISNLERVTIEKEKLSIELHIAASIQESMLPSIFPAFPERKDIDIYALMAPAREVGGDFYDFFFIDEGHMAVVVADVSGKGVPASLFMVITKTLIKNEALSGKSVGEIFTTVNHQLVENNKEDMFVTAFMGILELSSGRFCYVSAGHNPPLYKAENGNVVWLREKPSFVLAGLYGTCYTEYEMELKAGDLVFLYTDGVTEALNIIDEFYGEDRLFAIFKELVENTGVLEEILHNIQNDIIKFANTAVQADDITMLIFRYLG